jgi:hypothetical protein
VHQELNSKLAPLKPFVDRAASYSTNRNRYFGACVRAALVRAFELAQLAAVNERRDDAFFLMPALRGVAEDLIYLRFISQLPPVQREDLVKGLMLLELEAKLGYQSSFFGVFRPFQPILRPGGTTRTDDVKDEVRAIWRAHGWPGLRSVTPPTREIAQKSDPGVLEVVYDFIYRLTSSTVHFNPQILLRSGWGKTKTKMKFSTRNMSGYYALVSQTYGSYLLTLYFELFPKFLRPDHAIKSAVTDLREFLGVQLRWPEMVTFEEMNQPVPESAFERSLMWRVAYAVMAREGFIRTASGKTPPLAQSNRLSRGAP